LVTFDARYSSAEALAKVGDANHYYIASVNTQWWRTHTSSLMGQLRRAPSFAGQYLRDGVAFLRNAREAVSSGASSSSTAVTLSSSSSSSSSSAQPSHCRQVLVLANYHASDADAIKTGKKAYVTNAYTVETVEKPPSDARALPVDMYHDTFDIVDKVNRKQVDVYYPSDTHAGQYEQWDDEMFTSVLVSGWSYWLAKDKKNSEMSFREYGDIVARSLCAAARAHSTYVAPTAHNQYQ
jgi:hypothetical protein